MNRRLTAGVAALAVLLAQVPAWAQDGGSMSVFRMFFFPLNQSRALEWFGVLLIWVILALSVVVVALVLQNALRYKRENLLPRTTGEEIARLLDDKQYRQAIDYAAADPSYLGKVVSGALNEVANGYPAMERAIQEVGDNQTVRMLRPLEWLNILGNIAPMLGLFGTVYGIIVAFSDLMASGGRPDPGKLAGGISTALVTTFWGLIVAIPALAAYAWFRNKVDELTSEGLIMAEELIRPFKPGAKKGSTPKSDRPEPRDARPDKPAARPMATPKPIGENESE